MCNNDCFNCKYNDCIKNEITKEEFKIQNELDKIIKDENVLTERQRRYIKEKEKNAEKLKERSRKYYHNNKEKCKEKNKKYYETHKEKFKEYDRLRKQTHPIRKEKRHEYYINWKIKKENQKKRKDRS